MEGAFKRRVAWQGVPGEGQREHRVVVVYHDAADYTDNVTVLCEERFEDAMGRSSWRPTDEGSWKYLVSRALANRMCDLEQAGGSFGS